MRGGTAGQAGDEAQDSIRSHAHELTEHAHTLSIKDAASKDDVASMTPIYDTVNVGGISGVPTMKVCFSGFNDDIYRINFDDVYYLCPKYGVYNTIRVGRVLDYKDKNFTVHCGFPFTMYFEICVLQGFLDPLASQQRYKHKTQAHLPPSLMFPA